MTSPQWGPPAGQGWQPRPAVQAYGGQAFGVRGYGPAPQSGFFRPQVAPPPGPLAPFGAPPPPRRRGGGLRSLLRALVVLAVLAVLALIALNSLGGNVTGSSTSTDSGVAYQNENYRVPPPDKNPPPLPQPQTYSQAQTYITNNQFYAQTVPEPVRCEVSAINVATGSDSQLKKHFEDLMACLLRVWQPPVVGAKFQIVRPTVTIYGASVQTRCGKSSVNAFYCSADQQVYYSNQLARYLAVLRTYDRAADIVMAHEFGHALQARTGILISAHALGQQSGAKETELLFSRRLETQADCFSGMWMRSVALSLGMQQSDLAKIQSVYAAVGDDAVTGDSTVDGDHGLSRTRVYWGTQGIGNANVSTCNTFTAPASQLR